MGSMPGTMEIVMAVERLDLTFLGLIIHIIFVKSSVFISILVNCVSILVSERHFMSRNRCKALLGVIHVSEPIDDLNSNDKLQKIRDVTVNSKQTSPIWVRTLGYGSTPRGRDNAVQHLQENIIAMMTPPPNVKKKWMTHSPIVR